MDDTFIPTGLAEGSEITGEMPVGRLNTFDVGSDSSDNEHGVDFIDPETKAPDGIIESRFIVTDLYPEDEESS